MAHRTAKLGKQGRIVIPASVRKELDLKPGDELVARTEDDAIVLQTREALLRKIQREFIAATGDRDVVAELIAERRREAAKEETEYEEWLQRQSSTHQH